MILGLAALEQIGGATEQALRTLIGILNTGFHQEHNADNTHSTIHASGKIYERGRTKGAMGETIAVPFVPANYTATGAMTWTVTAGMVTTFAYSLIGTRMFVDVAIVSSTVAGVANTALQVAIPDGWFAAATVTALCRVVDNGTAAIGFAQVIAAGRVIQFFRNDGANWGTGAANNSVQGQISFEVRTA